MIKLREIEKPKTLKTKRFNQLIGHKNSRYKSNN